MVATHVDLILWLQRGVGDEGCEAVLHEQINHGSQRGNAHLSNVDVSGLEEEQ